MDQRRRRHHACLIIVATLGLVCHLQVAWTSYARPSRSLLGCRRPHIGRQAQPDKESSTKPAADKDWEDKEMDLYAETAKQYSPGDKDADWRLAAFAGIFILLIAVGFTS
mmetsp:Transcript_44510/g.81306  ORF Transcript_44510/g.81306 Transcript_44510/m.81306 type:complete len:110 (+) Transcript_44510:55-384(+)